MTFSTEIKNPKIFDLLFNEAQNAETIQTSRHSSAIVYKKQVIGVGRNSRKTHPLSVKFNGATKPCIHAELAAIISVVNNYGADILKKCDIYCLRITNTDKVAIAKPCDGCSKAILAFGIRRTFYTV